MRLRKCYVNGKVMYGNSNFGSNVTSQLGSETCQCMSLEPKELMQRIVDGDIAGISPYVGGYDEESSDLEGFFTQSTRSFKGKSFCFICSATDSVVCGLRE